jgi:ATP-dependent RNA helicase HelY
VSTPPGTPPDRTHLLAGYDFELDPFQLEALDALDSGRSVLVAAPTGSGKTVVAEYAVARALAEGGKAFYTTPLKALSNQKYGDLVRRHGAERVGLLTGDNTINGEAPVVVMTTEVLRNMIYAASPTLEGLHYVVLDEVHFLQDAYRGPVWEEVIIHSSPSVQLVCLSATVSNAEDLARWISTVRGETSVVIEERRPVELDNLYLVGDRAAGRVHLLPTLVDGRPNPEAARLDSQVDRRPAAQARGRPRRRLYTPRRTAVVELLDDEAMLPVIYFIFSRAACDDATRQCLAHGLRLTTPEERRRIRAIVEDRLSGLSGADLDVLGWDAWIAALEAGFAAHHAGLVPPFKEAVEACFSAGLVKVVFATETLALGINMPARSVVIEQLTKFTGESHELLTPGEYTQLTGRAGRRGIDDRGHAVVLWSPWITFEQVAGLASTRTYELTSAFRPTYNMAANLVHRYPPDTAHHLLSLSFAQYRADAEVVRLQARLERNGALLERARLDLRCDRGDVQELLDLEGRLRQARRRRPAAGPMVRSALARLQPGDIIRVRGGKSAGAVAVISVSQRRGGAARVRAVTPRARVFSLRAEDFDEPPPRLGRIDLPEPYQPNTAAFRRGVADRLKRARTADGGRLSGRDDGIDDGGLSDLADAVAAHPVATCPEGRTHRRAVQQIARLERERAALERRTQARNDTLARQFDRVLALLEERGYLEGWTLRPAGHRLRGIFHEADLLIGECLAEGLFDGLDPAALAGLVSCFTFQSRGRGEGSRPWFPSPLVRRRWDDIVALREGLVGAEERAALPTTRELDAGFVALAHAWAAGEELDDVLADEELSGGDFVRNVRQLVDLLQQLGDVAPDPATARSARQAADRLQRGVVAASSRVAAG